MDAKDFLMVGDSWGLGMKKYFPTNTSVVSSGLFTRGGLPSAADQIKNSNYSNGVIIVHSGGNDIGMRGPKKNGKSLVADDVRQTINAAKAKGCKVIFVAAPWLNHTSTNVTNNRDKYNSWLKEAAISNGAGYIDTSSMLNYMQQHQPTRGNFHLNDYSGYANYILKEAQKLVSNIPQQSKQNMNINWRSEKPNKVNRWGSPGKEYSNTNAMALMNFLINKGLSLEAAAGIAGNLMSESGFNPYNYVSTDVNGPSGGIAMWHNNRLNKLKQFANKRGKAWTDIETQAEYLWHELTEGGYKHVLNKLKNVKTIEDASFIWGDEYEVFAGHQNRNGKNHNIRRNNAINFANLYKSLKPTMQFTAQSAQKTIDANPTENTQPIDYFGTTNDQFGNEFRESSIAPQYNDDSQSNSKAYIIENPIYGIDYRKAYYDYLNAQKYQHGGITFSKLRIYRNGGDFSYLTSNPLMKKVLSDTSHMCYTKPSVNYNNKKMWRAVRGSGATDMRPSPTGKCTNGPATWYRNAGIPIFFWSNPSKATVSEMKHNLTKAGFQQVWAGTGQQANSQLEASGILKPGDVATMLSKDSAHAVMWTGKDWRSDFVQKNGPYPYSSIGRGGNETFILWRHPDLQDNKPQGTIKFTQKSITDNKENSSNNVSTLTAEQTYVQPENDNYLYMNNQFDTEPYYLPSDKNQENTRKKYSIENSIQGIDYRKAYYSYLNKRYQDGGQIFKPVQSDILGIFKIKNTNPIKLPSKTLDFAKIIQKYLDSKTKTYQGLLNVYGDTFKSGGKFSMGHPEDIGYEDDIYYNPPKESSTIKDNWNNEYEEIYYNLSKKSTNKKNNQSAVYAEPNFNNTNNKVSTLQYNYPKLLDIPIPCYKNTQLNMNFNLPTYDQVLPNIIKFKLKLPYFYNKKFNT